MTFTQLRVPIALGLIVGIIGLVSFAMLSSPRQQPIAVQPAVDKIECVLYWKNAPTELRTPEHADDECAVSVIRRAQP
jgi:hypothetical protein